MKNLIILSYLIISCFSLFSQEQEIPWDSKKRIEETHSIGIDEKRSFHVVSYRDLKTSKYGITTFVTNASGFTREFESISFEELPSVLSHQFNADTQSLTLAVAYEKRDYRALEIIAFDWDSGKQSFQEKVGPLNQNGVVVRNSEGITIVQKRDTLLGIRPIRNQEFTAALEVPITYLSTMDLIFQNGVQWVDQNEYVAHGSVYPSKVYEDKGKLYFVLQKEKSFKVVTLDMNTPKNQTFIEFNIPEIKKYQDTYSYVFKGKLLIFYHNVNDINIEIFDIEKRKALQSYSLVRDFKHQVNRRAIAPLMNTFKEAKHHLTAAINEGLEGELVISFDYVDVDAYKYGKDSYFNQHFHDMFFQQMWQQQQLMHQQWLNTIPNRIGGGPNVGEMQFEVVSPVVKEKQEPVRFSVVLQPDLSISKEPLRKTYYQNAENHPIFKTIKDDKKRKHSSATTAGKECRYIYYNKKIKAFKFGSNVFAD